MNTRIYFNQKFIEFTGNEPHPIAIGSSQNQSINIPDTSEGEKKLKNVMNGFIHELENKNITINGISFKKALEFFKRSFYYIEAAGGLIEKDSSFLFIRRHGVWDLPKGKLEKNETIEHAAVRECEEECGISDLTIIKPLSSTFHLYPYKNGHALKQSYWFYMQTNYSKELIPQTEESITEVRWFKRPEIESIVLRDTYFTISDVTCEFLEF